MSALPAFHLTDTPLTRGTTLVEASAGTGKTYAITALFIRLILEQNLAVNEILTVTYTEAATAELRQRWRRRCARLRPARAKRRFCRRSSTVTAPRPAK